MLNDKTTRAASRKLAALTDQITAPAIVEMTSAEIAQVAGGLEQQRAL